MRAADFDFHLPPESIAQRPAPRGSSRLLVLAAEGAERHRRILDLPSMLKPGDLLVVNNTKVIPARLFGRRRPSGGKLELLLLEKQGTRGWLSLARPGKRAKPGTVIEFADSQLTATVLGKAGEAYELEFSEEVEPHLEDLGHVPLPPYIQRQDDPADRHTYQTVFARHEGAIAAPTAGLHFSEELLAELEQLGVARREVTLHVGIGTFKPVTVDEVAAHRMEEERWHVPADTAQAIRETRQRGGRVVAVGTTVVRTLESAARDSGQVMAGAGRTDLFITPGFEFRAVDALLTNFHLPRSTLVMLVSALAGANREDPDAGRQRVLAGYKEAVAEGYCFYSYGDAMFVERG